MISQWFPNFFGSRTTYKNLVVRGADFGHHCLNLAREQKSLATPAMIYYTMYEIPDSPSVWGTLARPAFPNFFESRNVTQIFPVSHKITWLILGHFC